MNPTLINLLIGSSLPKNIYTYPLDQKGLSNYFSFSSCLLDIGCGYGCSVNEVKKLRYSNVIGIDNALGSEMVVCGKPQYSELDLPINDGAKIPF